MVIFCPPEKKSRSKQLEVFSITCKRIRSCLSKMSDFFLTNAMVTSLFLQTWELINTALLTGKQVSQPMKIFVVSQSGKIADVTRQSTCHTEDDSVLKVPK